MQQRLWALRHRTTDPEPRRTIPSSLLPSGPLIFRTCTRSAMPRSLRDPGPQAVDATPPTFTVTALVNDLDILG